MTGLARFPLDQDDSEQVCPDIEWTQSAQHELLWWTVRSSRTLWRLPARPCRSSLTPAPAIPAYLLSPVKTGGPSSQRRSVGRVVSGGADGGEVRQHSISRNVVPSIHFLPTPPECRRGDEAVSAQEVSPRCCRRRVSSPVQGQCASGNTQAGSNESRQLTVRPSYPTLPYPTLHHPTPSPYRYAEATLGSGNLRLAVVLPEGEDLNEWLAVNSESA